jgi:hypothetical protein
MPLPVRTRIHRENRKAFFAVVANSKNRLHLLLRRTSRIIPAAAFLAALLLSAAIALLPWEQCGAPILALLVFGGAALVFIRLDSPMDERPFTRRLFIAASVMNGLAALVYNLVLHGPLLSDAVSYDRIAAVLSGAAGGSLPVDQALGPLAWMKYEIYPHLIAGIYRLIGQSPNAIIAIHVILGGASVYLVYRITALLLGPVTARFAGALAAMYTGFWIFSLMMLKDGLSLFLVLFFYYCLYRLWRGMFLPGRRLARLGRGSAWLVLLAGAGWLAGELREYVTPVMLAAAGSLILVRILRTSGRAAALAALAVILAAAVLLWPRIAGYHLVAVTVDEGSTLEQFVEIPPTDTVGALAEWAAANPLPFGKYMLLAAGSTAVAPYAWILPVGREDSPAFSAYSVAIPGMWLWYVCLPFAVLGACSAWKRSKGAILPLLVYTVFLFLLFSLLIPRETRHRDLLMPFLLMFSAEGLVCCRSRWPIGIFFWIPLLLFMAWKVHALPALATVIVVATAILAVWFFARVRRKGGVPPAGG